MAIVLEPCPFCRSTHLHLAHSGLDYCVVCQRCKSKGPHQGEFEQAIGRWNHASRCIGDAGFFGDGRYVSDESQEGVKEAVQPIARYSSARS